VNNNIAGKLAGKIAVITGAISGLALATAKLFVAEGGLCVHHRSRKSKSNSLKDDAVEFKAGSLSQNECLS